MNSIRAFCEGRAQYLLFTLMSELTNKHFSFQIVRMEMASILKVIRSGTCLYIFYPCQKSVSGVPLLECHSNDHKMLLMKHHPRFVG